MSALQLLLVAVAGAVGALLRHELTTRPDPVRARRATAVVNVLGAGALGVAAVAVDGTALLVLGGGLLGSATTFSTWMVQAEGAAAPGADGGVRSVCAALAVPLVLGVVAAAAGRLLATGIGLGS